jgi:hypothetical protein
MVQSASQTIYETLHVPAPIAWNSSPKHRQTGSFAGRLSSEGDCESQKEPLGIRDRISARRGARGRLMRQCTAELTAAQIARNRLTESPERGKLKRMS